jgi:hypothetical protein
LRLIYLAYDILGNSLSKEDYQAFITRYDEPLHDAHDIWTRIKDKFDDSKYVSGSTNEDEEDERRFMQLYAHLSLEDRAAMLKLLKIAREQSEALYKLKDVLIRKL